MPPVLLVPRGSIKVVAIVNNLLRPASAITRSFPRNNANNHGRSSFVPNPSLLNCMGSRDTGRPTGHSPSPLRRQSSLIFPCALLSCVYRHTARQNLTPVASADASSPSLPIVRRARSHRFLSHGVASASARQSKKISEPRPRQPHL